MNINKNKKITVFTFGPGEILNIDVFIGIVLIFSVNPKTVNITNLSSYIKNNRDLSMTTDKLASFFNNLIPFSI